MVSYDGTNQQKDTISLCRVAKKTEKTKFLKTSMLSESFHRTMLL